MTTTSTGEAAPTRPTMRQVAALAQVSLKTVSRVVNSEDGVSAETVRRVESAVRQLNYQPNLIAGNLKRADGRTASIGLLVGNVANPFSAAVHRAVEQEAWQRGVAVFAASLDEDPDREEALVSAFLRRRVDGLILTAATRHQRYLLPEIARGTPIVFIDREPVGVAADAVVSHNRDGARQATEHLLAAGHRRLAYVGDRLSLQTARERLAGFEEAVAAHPGAEAVATVSDIHDTRTAEIEVRRVLDSPTPPTALFTAQNLSTMGAVRALHELGAQHRVALVGFDDVPMADLLDPGISVVGQDPDTIGRTAAARLFRRLDGHDDPTRTTSVPVRLVARGSGELPPPA